MESQIRRNNNKTWHCWNAGPKLHPYQRSQQIDNKLRTQPTNSRTAPRTLCLKQSIIKTSIAVWWSTIIHSKLDITNLREKQAAKLQNTTNTEHNSTKLTFEFLLFGLAGLTEHALLHTTTNNERKLKWVALARGQFHWHTQLTHNNAECNQTIIWRCQFLTWKKLSIFVPIIKHEKKNFSLRSAHDRQNTHVSSLLHHWTGNYGHTGTQEPELKRFSDICHHDRPNENKTGALKWGDGKTTR